MQRSKVTWLNLRDRNNSYFHASVKEKNKHKDIYTPNALDSKVLNTHDQIEDEILDLYTALVGTNAMVQKGIDISEIRRWKMLPRDHAQQLIQHIQDKEIWEALMSIGNAKAPGVDGFNAYFYKTSWHIIRVDVKDVIHEFFCDNKLYITANYSLVTLIPKFYEAKTIKDMRHIACCSTIYTIISKILTCKLGKVINSMIDDNQSSFFPKKIYT